MFTPCFLRSFRGTRILISNRRMLSQSSAKWLISPMIVNCDNILRFEMRIGVPRNEHPRRLVTRHSYCTYSYARLDSTILVRVDSTPMEFASYLASRLFSYQRPRNQAIFGLTALKYPPGTERGPPLLGTESTKSGGVMSRKCGTAATVHLPPIIFMHPSSSSTTLHAGKRQVSGKLLFGVTTQHSLVGFQKEASCFLLDSSYCYSCF
jgi:hypothetical protein